jgi:hypothetical protein
MIPPWYEIIVGNEHANAAAGADRGAIPPPDFGALNEAPRIASAVASVLKRYNRDLTVMRANFRTLAARKRSNATCRINNDRGRALSNSPTDVNVDLPVDFLLQYAPQNSISKNGGATFFTCPRQGRIELRARQVQPILTWMGKVVCVVWYFRAPIRFHASAHGLSSERQAGSGRDGAELKNG